MSEDASMPHGARPEVLIRSLKFDGRVHREWRARLARREGRLLVFEGTFAEEVRHPLLGTIPRGALSTEYYWLDRWYSIFRFSEPDGAHRCFYCNVNRPPEFDGRLLTFVDLDIDVLVDPDFNATVLDEDEFEQHAAQFDYPADVRASVHAARDELLRLVEARAFPFGEKF